jgi:S-adenosyl methyltransferase
MMTEAQQAPPGVDPTRPSPARLYDFYLGGSDNYPADRAAAEKLYQVVPELPDAAWANRGFHQRATRWMAAELGIRQFIDIGCGLPTRENTHQAAHREVADARVLYVDNDPLVRALAGGLLSGEGRTRFIAGDVRDPDSVLNHPETRELIDLTEPVGLLMTAVLQFVADESDPWRLVTAYTGAAVPGSCLALTHITADSKPPAAVAAFIDIYANATERIYLRPKAEVERFFTALHIVPPYPNSGSVVTWMGEWGAEDAEAADSDGSRWGYGAVGVVQ